MQRTISCTLDGGCVAGGSCSLQALNVHGRAFEFLDEGRGGSEAYTRERGGGEGAVGDSDVDSRRMAQTAGRRGEREGRGRGAGAREQKEHLGGPQGAKGGRPRLGMAVSRAAVYSCSIRVSFSQSPTSCVRAT